MNQQADKMMTGGVEMKKLNIERVRQPRQRMPETSLSRRGQRPLETLPIESAADVGIVGDVAVVVAIDKRVARNRVVKNQSSQNQQQTQNCISLRRRGEQASARWSSLSSLKFCGTRRHLNRQCRLG